MGREVRRVPANWQHPKDENGSFIPLYGRAYEIDAKSWDEECEKWEAGEFPDYASEESKKLTFEEWSGSRPVREHYMPSWKKEDCTHYMMYEDTSEGTPISPAFETPEELAEWLADTAASSFAGMTASYEQWLRVANGGYACSAVYSSDRGLVSGVEGLSDK